MSWNPELLTTTATLAEHEKEINDLAGSTQVWSLLGGAIDESTDYEVTCPADTDYVIYQNTDGKTLLKLAALNQKELFLETLFSTANF